MKISVIVAMDLDWGIGRDNDLMWHLPADMRFFRETTSGHIVVMGRKNYESIPERFRPLPNRENAVLTRNQSFSAEGCRVFHSLTSCLDHYNNEKERTVFIIGGGQLYTEVLESFDVDEMFITHVNKRYGADVFFPRFDLRDWEIETIREQAVNEQHEASFTILKYSRI